MNFQNVFRNFIIGAIIILILAIVQFYTIGKTDEVAFYQAFSKIVKIVLVGFLIGLLGILIPQMLPNKKYEFEMQKEAKEKYSEAKTEIDNLPHTLQFITSPQKALEIVKKVQTQKHLAECYSEFLPNKNPEEKNSSAQIWHKGYLPFRRIDSCRKEIQENINTWKSMLITDRYDKIVERIEKETKKEANNE